MSDFDAVLERLLTEPEFAAGLAADPGAALAGYRLDPDEEALLRTQVSGDTGGQHAVEVRATQSSLFGMLSPLAGLVDGVALTGGGGFATAGGHIGPGVPPVGSEAFRPVAGVAGFGGVAAVEGLGSADPVQGFGPAPAAAVAGLGPAVADGRAATGAYGAVQGLGAAPPSGPGPDTDPPAGYRTRVDVDGDGGWDRHTLRGRADGGVDILVDLNRDGAVDFVGRDLDADGLVDTADYDVDRDGVFDRRAADLDGDGWLDRSAAYPGPASPAPESGLANLG